MKKLEDKRGHERALKRQIIYSDEKNGNKKVFYYAKKLIEGDDIFEKQLEKLRKLDDKTLNEVLKVDPNIEKDILDTRESILKILLELSEHQKNILERVSISKSGEYKFHITQPSKNLKCVYHGTNIKSAQKIVTEGIKPNYNLNINRRSFGEVFFTDRFDDAATYINHHLKNGNGVVFEININNYLDDLFRAAFNEVTYGYFLYDTTIQPEDIKRIIYIDENKNVSCITKEELLNLKEE